MNMRLAYIDLKTHLKLSGQCLMNLGRRGIDYKTLRVFGMGYQCLA